jgi:hypothetical protein
MKGFGHTHRQFVYAGGLFLLVKFGGVRPVPELAYYGLLPLVLGLILAYW